MVDLRTYRAALLVCTAAVLALPLAGCGRRGALEAPESETRAASQPVAARPAAGSPPRSTVTMEGAGDEADDQSARPAPRRPFILDAIL